MPDLHQDGNPSQKKSRPASRARVKVATVRKVPRQERLPFLSDVFPDFTTSLMLKPLTAEYSCVSSLQF